MSMDNISNLSKAQKASFWLALSSLSIHLLWYHGAKSLLDLAAALSLFVILLNRGESFFRLSIYQIIWCVFLICLPLSYMFSYSLYNSPIDKKLLWESIRTALICLGLHISINHTRIEICNKLIMSLMLCALLGGGAGFVDWVAKGFAGRTSAGAQIINLYAAVLTSATLIVFVYFFNLRQRILRYISLLAVTLGLLGVVASGSRSALIVLLALIFVISVYKTRGRIRYYALGSIVALCLCVVSLTAVQNRIYDGYEDVSQYFNEGATLEEKTTSIGLRLEMWIASAEAISENPFFGYGNKPLDDIFKERILNKKSPEMFKIFNHVHNDLLQAELSRGIFGLLICILFIFYPMWISVKLDMHNKEWIFTLAFSYFLIGLSDVLLVNSVSLVFYLVVMSLLLIPCKSYKVVKSEHGLGEN